MNDQDYFRKAVELADGWRYFRKDSPENPISYFSTPVDDSWWNWDEWHPCHLDALAAQLVRQVNATKSHWVRILPGSTTIFSNPSNDERQTTCGDNSTMNTIKAIVDSKVLE